MKQRPEKDRSWDSFWDRPVPDGIDDFLRERPDVIEPRRFEPSEEDLADGDLADQDLRAGNPANGERKRGA